MCRGENAWSAEIILWSEVRNTFPVPNPRMIYNIYTHSNTPDRSGWDHAVFEIQRQAKKIKSKNSIQEFLHQMGEMDYLKNTGEF